MSANLASSDSFYVEIDDACERFEAAWRSGGQPRIEPYVAEVPEGARPELICELLKLDIYYRRERGDTILPADYAAFPEHASLVETLLGPALLPEELAGHMQAGRYRLGQFIGEGGMADVPLAERRDKLKCGVAVVDLRSGQVTALLDFQTAVEEIFDVQVLAGLRFPEVVGFQKDAVQHTFVVPAEKLRPA
jgi:hypothetical protein